MKLEVKELVRVKLKWMKSLVFERKVLEVFDLDMLYEF